MALSGFTWSPATSKAKEPAESNPSSGAGTPQRSIAADPIVVSSAKTSMANSTTGPSVSTSVSPVPITDNPASQSRESPAETTHVQVTRTITVQPAATALIAAAAPSIPSSHTLHSAALPPPRTKTPSAIPAHSPAPNLSPSIIFQLADPPTNHPPPITPPPLATKPTTHTNNAAIAGIIIGSLSAGLLILILLCCLRKRVSTPDTERAPNPRRRRTHASRSLDHRGHPSTSTSPVRHGERVERQHGGAWGRNSDDGGVGIDPAALAQAMGWQCNFAPGGFEHATMSGGSVVLEGGEMGFGTAQLQQQRGKGVRRQQRISGVSPLSLDGEFVRAGVVANGGLDVSPLSLSGEFVRQCGGNGQHDVSPLGSPALVQYRY
ncbi:hypothetical protein J1614_006616 [Plenodomus biglobosus]|nr:hypothetical protein J1614_006616 [Plenodomus biglobosus]